MWGISDNMTLELSILTITAASIGFIHTLFGPDHYLPFIMIARARNWSLLKTTWITFLCGIGHVGSSVIIGFIGIAFGIGITKLTDLESIRGSIAAWFLIAFGLTYFIWGLHRALKIKPHKHLHTHGNATSHIHDHKHIIEHTHVHDVKTDKNITPWILFVIFIFGPCEPLIPLLMYPAATSSINEVILVTSIFSIATITTMLGVVIISSLGTNLLRLGRIERYVDAIAGATICFSGVGIKLLGL